MRTHRLRLVLATLAAAAAVGIAAAPSLASGAEFAKDDRPELLVVPTDYPETPETFAIGAKEGVDVANGTAEVKQQRERRGKLRVSVADENNGWKVSYFDDDEKGSPEVAQVVVDGPTGVVREAWTGYQVAWPMARGNEGQFGHILNAPWVWLPLSALFFAGLANWRAPWRIAHLDLLVLLGFGISHIYFNLGEIGLSAPLAYPPLVYLLVRMIWIGFARRSEPLRPSASTALLAFLVVGLIALRITFNVADSGVIDVGYAGVIGAERIEQGKAVWGEEAFPENNPTGDTYGPSNYLAYLPFHRAFGWSGEWDDLPTAHAAAITFDLLAVIGLFFLGRMLGGYSGREGRMGRWSRGPYKERAKRAEAREATSPSFLAWLERNRLGIILAFAWLAFPYTDFALQSSSNDSLLAAGVIWALVLFGRPAARGAVLAFTTLTKFAPAVLGPLFVAGSEGLSLRRMRGPVLAALAFAIVALPLIAWPALSPGLDVFWERTIESQADRESPFSIWGQVDLGPAQQIVWIGTALFVASLAFVPRRRSLGQVCALAAAAIIAVQLTIDHWFYLYIPWFFGPAIAAVLATRTSYPAGSSTCSMLVASPSRPTSITTALIQGSSSADR